MAKKVVKKEVKTLVKVEKSEVKLISFTVGATIPTMSYGNIQPSITVEAKNINEAKEAVMPFIEELYASYAVEKLKTASKATVTVEEKKVAPTTVAPVTQAPVLPVTNSGTPEEITPGSPAFEKAAKAVDKAPSIDALDLIENQIQKSEKLTNEEKPVLLTLVLKKRKEF